MLPALHLQLLKPVEHQLLGDGLQYEGAFRCLDVEGALLGLQWVGEGGAAELHPAQRGHILRRAVVEQLVLLVLVGEPALLPGSQRTPLLLQIPTQFGFN